MTSVRHQKYHEAPYLGNAMKTSHVNISLNRIQTLSLQVISSRFNSLYHASSFCYTKFGVWYVSCITKFGEYH